LVEEVDFVGHVEDILLYSMNYLLPVDVQKKTCIGVITKNGGQCSAKDSLMGGDWKDTNETYFLNDPTEFQQEESKQLQVPAGSILYHPVMVNTH
jgi:hypothetical protein